jgi:beta-lactamase superfamily II metal-dependent hydrolase
MAKKGAAITMLGDHVGLYCLEVGKGSATAIIEPIPGRSPTECQAVLIDVAEPHVEVAKWLQDVGVKRIAAILLTHNDRDHIGSLYDVVHAFKPNTGSGPKIGKVRFLVDRRSAPKFWVDATKWCEDGWIEDADLLGTPLWSSKRRGELVVGSPDVSFSLYCLYPPRMFWTDLVSGFKLLMSFFRGGKNQLSAVLRLAPTTQADATQVLFGGDLDYKGWEYLSKYGWSLHAPVVLVPHHGGPQRATRKFGASHLSAETRSTYALVSTASDNSDDHPHEDLVKEFGKGGTTVLCTQITPKCLSAGAPPVSRDAVLPREPKAPRLCSAGTACAGTIVITFPNTGPVVQRVLDHQTAVDQLQTNGHRPLCRR